MSTVVGERIKVMAVFEGGGVRPVKFRWRDRVYPVRDVTYTWRAMEGSARVVHFSVTDGSTLFELSYNTSTMGWSIENVELMWADRT